LAQAKTPKPDPDMSNPIGHQARGVLDISGVKLIDRPPLLEEKLLQTRGIFSVEINAFSSRVTVEFDPSMISLDKIRAMIKSSSGR
jgi:hypothetical protein